MKHDYCNPSHATVCTHNPVRRAQMSMDDVLLSTGRTVIHQPMCNGATDVSIIDGDSLTQAEWNEYAGLIVKAQLVASLIKRNVDNWYADKIDHTEFERRQAKIWAKARRCGVRTRVTEIVGKRSLNTVLTPTHALTRRKGASR